MNRIAEIRKEKGITQIELAARSGVSQPYIVDLEHGRRGASPDTWARIAEALGVQVDELREAS